MSKIARGEHQPFDIINNYRVIKLIGRGGFADIYFVRDMKTNAPCAMKIERREKFDSKSGKSDSRVDVEYAFVRQLQSSLYFPHLYDCGIYQNLRFIVMEILGPSLFKLARSLPGAKLSLSTALRVGVESVCILHELHCRGLIHRDVKPENFLIRPGSPTPLCLCDFGLATRTKSENSNKSREFIGTIKYASIFAMKGQLIGPRDDMISWIYSMIELITGTLPWSHILSNTISNYNPNTDGNNSDDRNMNLNDEMIRKIRNSNKEAVCRMKEKITPDELCARVPIQFIDIYKSLIDLEFDQLPDYDFIVLSLSNALRDAGARETDPFDWESLSEDAAYQISPIPLDREAPSFSPSLTHATQVLPKGFDQNIDEKSSKTEDVGNKNSEVAAGVSSNVHTKGKRVLEDTALLVAAGDDMEENIDGMIGMFGQVRRKVCRCCSIC
ncbi:CK1 family protein kinase [Tritrichomonas foetus]|uniref:non-specific serine/threonine protein kinase n=1 Tax=Tritrichomonas foetus TaxID=1144522 RepID=A0A1J4JK62_9EUKA|nr:CK1 family protein kinase [Tritrichomonas foetus]|eukprot:OHS97957.1 CK1 family protein kinase [Tritrichomonas foetus]